MVFSLSGLHDARYIDAEMSRFLVLSCGVVVGVPFPCFLSKLERVLERAGLDAGQLF